MNDPLGIPFESEVQRLREELDAHARAVRNSWNIPLSLWFPKGGPLLSVTLTLLSPNPERQLGATDWAVWMRRNLDVRLIDATRANRKPTDEEFEMLILLYWYWPRGAK